MPDIKSFFTSLAILFNKFQKERQQPLQTAISALHPAFFKKERPAKQVFLEIKYYISR
jgi:hypothetical protein